MTTVRENMIINKVKEIKSLGIFDTSRESFSDDTNLMYAAIGYINEIYQMMLNIDSTKLLTNESLTREIRLLDNYIHSAFTSNINAFKLYDLINYEVDYISSLVTK